MKVVYLKVCNSGLLRFSFPFGAVLKREAKRRQPTRDIGLECSERVPLSWMPVSVLKIDTCLLLH